MKYLIYFYFLALVTTQSAALSYTTRHIMPPKFGGKWGTQVLNGNSDHPDMRSIHHEVKRSGVIHRQWCLDPLMLIWISLGFGRMTRCVIQRLNVCAMNVGSNHTRGID